MTSAKARLQSLDHKLFKWAVKKWWHILLFLTFYIPAVGFCTIAVVNAIVEGVKLLLLVR